MASTWDDIRGLLSVSNVISIGGAPSCVGGITLLLFWLKDITTRESAWWLTRYIAKNISPSAIQFSGLIASLPFVVGPMLLGAALQPDQSATNPSALAARDMAQNSLCGVIGYLTFLVAASMLSPAIERLFGPGTATCKALRLQDRALQRHVVSFAVIAVGVVAFALLGVAFYAPGLKLGVLLANTSPLLLALCLSLVLCGLGIFLWKTSPAATIKLGMGKWTEVSVRAGAALAISFFVFFLRKKAPAVAGYVGVFPTATGVILLTVMASAGASGVQSLMRGMLCGASGMVWFLATLSCLLEPGNVGWAFFWAALCAVAAAYCTFLLINKEQRTKFLSKLGLRPKPLFSPE